jgi:hypothetical protein
MVLGFKEQFKKPISDGSKIHSIRDDKSRRWKAGMLIQMATGIRTSNYHCFNSSHYCVSVQDVFMSFDGSRLDVSIDGKEIFGGFEREQFAKNDGFESYAALSQWFIPLCKKNDDWTYSGRLIHWTEYRY